MQPKLFFEQTLQSFLLVFLPFIFEYILSHVLTTLSIHENECDIKFITSWWFDCDSKLKTFVIFEYSCTIYFIVRLKDFIHLL